MKLYRDFVKFDRDYFFHLEKIETKFDDEFLRRYYDEVYRPTFVEFVLIVRDLLVFQNAWKVFDKMSTVIEDILSFLLFLREVGIAEFQKSGRLLVKDDSLLESLVKPLKWRDVRKILERKIGNKFRLRSPFSSNLGIHHDWAFTIDQMPMTTYSLLRNVEKVMEFFPLKDKILLVGDDDFLSIALASFGYSPVVVDIDQKLLEEIDGVAENLGLEVELLQVDVLKRRRIGERVTSFHANPPATLEGARTFMNFGLESLNKKLGGICFLHLQTDLGNRQIELQKLISARNLKVLEVVGSLATYPGKGVGLEKDAYWREITKNLSGKISASSSFWIMSCVPWRVSKFKLGAYDYVF